MGLTVTGKVKSIDPTVNVSDKFKKREFVVTIADNPKYPQNVQFQITGDRIAQMDSVGVGDEVRLDFSLRGREWKSPSTGEVKHFNSLDVWKVEVVGKGSAEPPPPAFGDDQDIPF